MLFGSNVYQGIFREYDNFLAFEMISFRGTIFILIFLICYYLRNPFSPTPPHLLRSWSSGDSWAAWTTGTEMPGKAVMNDAQEGGPRIRQATMIYETDRFNTAYERSVDTHLRHGDKWGVPTHILRHDIVDAGFFNKPAFLLGLVINEMAKPYGKRAEWIVWFDADTIILNPGVPWSLFLPPPKFDNIHFLGTRDQNGFNAGMFMVRVNEWSVTMLSEVVALRTLQPNVTLDFYDQSAFAWVNNRLEHREHFLFQPHNWWNAFGLQGDPHPTDFFTLHFAGVDCCGEGDAKGVVMSRWLDKLDINPNEYYKSLDNMTLPREVSDYWQKLTDARKILEKGSAWENKTNRSRRDFESASLGLRKAIVDEADDLKRVTSEIEQLENIMSAADRTA